METVTQRYDKLVVRWHAQFVLCPTPQGLLQIALRISGGDLVPSVMNGKPVMVSRFAHTLRRSLWEEHLGLEHTCRHHCASHTVPTPLTPKPQAEESESEDVSESSEDEVDPPVPQAHGTSPHPVVPVNTGDDSTAPRLPQQPTTPEVLSRDSPASGVASALREDGNPDHDVVAASESSQAPAVAPSRRAGASGDSEPPHRRNAGAGARLQHASSSKRRREFAQRSRPASARAVVSGWQDRERDRRVSLRSLRDMTMATQTAVLTKLDRRGRGAARRSRRIRDFILASRLTSSAQVSAPGTLSRARSRSAAHHANWTLAPISDAQDDHDAQGDHNNDQSDHEVPRDRDAPHDHEAHDAGNEQGVHDDYGDHVDHDAKGDGDARGVDDAEETKGVEGPSCDAESKPASKPPPCACRVGVIQDPVTDGVYENLWMEIAKHNSRVYESVFVVREVLHRPCGCVGAASPTCCSQNLPRNSMKTFADVSATRGVPPQHPQRLQAILGHLVLFPVRFLCRENLAVRWNNVEFLVPKAAFL